MTMENNAFKDLVNNNSSSSSANVSSREIARKVVEEEFQKKKRKNVSDGCSSSDEDRNYQSSFNKRSKKFNQREDDAKAIKDDFLTPYRDRAKERREVKSATGTFPCDASNDFLIVPHNKKGLDLALLRKQRSKFQRTDDGGRCATNTEKTHKNDETTTRKEMPTLDHAKRILQAFLSAINKKYDIDSHNSNHNPTSLSNGVVEYLHELGSSETLHVSNWEGKNTRVGKARNSLQYTKFFMAIDGDPSDTERSWEIPRQCTLSRGNNEENVVSPSVLLPADLMKKISSTFLYRNSVREKTIEMQASIIGYRTRVEIKKETCYQEESDDMFGDEV